MRRRLAAAAVLLALPLSGCQMMQLISDGAYGNAVRQGIAAELDARGLELAGRPHCQIDDDRKASMVTIYCTARTRSGERVTASGVALAVDTPDPREEYVITVGGRVLLRKNCLGSGCTDRGAV